MRRIFASIILAFLNGLADGCFAASQWCNRVSKRFPDRTGKPIGWWEWFFLIGSPPLLAVWVIITPDIWVLRGICIFIAVVGGIQQWNERVALARKERP